MDAALVVPQVTNKQANKDFAVMLREEYAKPMANLPQGAWEPLSFLKAEYLRSMERIASLDVPPELKVVEERTLGKWDLIKRWIDELIGISPAIGALRSHQIVEALRSKNEPTRSASGVVAQPQEVKRNGILGRR